MRYFLVQIAVCLALFCAGQKTVSNPSPLVSSSFSQYLYVQFDNPVYITTGNIKSLTVTTDNGTITSTAEKGKYLIKPEKTGTTTITLSTKGYKKEFVFQAYVMQFPKIRLSGIPNEDGMIRLKESDGIAPNPLYDAGMEFTIDSFTVEIKDSISKSKYTNVGGRWNEHIKSLIKSLQAGSIVKVYGIHMSAQSRRFRSDDYLEYYIW